jgi:uncharacterized protein YjcR
MAQLTPRSEALAYRIWACCQPRGWGMTLADCAEELGESVHRVRTVAQHKGWSTRFKATSITDTQAFMRSSKGGNAYWPTGNEIRAAIADLAGRREAAE